jgi:large subunit ribosomal protein L3
MSYIIGQKIGMTRQYGKSQQTVPVTVVLALPNCVTQVKTSHQDGYEAIQVGAGQGRRHPNKPLTGHTKKCGALPKLIREHRVASSDHKVGDSLTVEQFATDDLVTVTAKSKGKGYAGVIKRHGFHGGPASHGSDHHRAPGSIGSQQPQRIPKGKKMAGHMGAKTVTDIKVKVIDVIKDENLILLNGSIPGPKKGWVIIKK